MMGAEWGLLGVLIGCFVFGALAGLVQEGKGDGATTYTMDVLMKDAKPLKPDAYLCSSYPVEEEEAYVVKFEALAKGSTAHHILMYGCEEGPSSTDDLWTCPPICKGYGKQQIMFAWAENAPATQLPKGVGLRIGKKTTVKTIVIQVHYVTSFKADDDPDRSGIRLTISKEKQPYIAGIFLMLSPNFEVPPNKPSHTVDISCLYTHHYSIHPFAFRTHAHDLGRVMSSYSFDGGDYHLIGKGNPHWPQAFYPTKSRLEIKPGDVLLLRCTYNSTGMNHTVSVGATRLNEMCNFYIMFYTDASVPNPYGMCHRSDFKLLQDYLPASSAIPLPPNPLLEEIAHGHPLHHHHQPMPSAPSPSSDGSVDASEELEGPGRTGDKQIQEEYPNLNPDEPRWFDLPQGGSSSSSLHDSFGQYLSEQYGPRHQQYPKEEPVSQYSASQQEQLEKNQRLGNIDPFLMQKRTGRGEYYDDYAANDEREQGTYAGLGDPNPGLSRNRNKAFEAMNQELKGFQHIKPHGEPTGIAGGGVVEGGPGYFQQQYPPQTMSRKKIGSHPEGFSGGQGRMDSRECWWCGILQKN